MFNKKFVALIVWYVTWNVISSFFSNKKWEDVKKEIKEAKKKWENFSKVFLDNFIETHKNLLEYAKKEVNSTRNKEFLNSKKAELLKIVDDYKIEWEKLLRELRSNGKDYLDLAKSKLKSLYDEKKWLLDSSKSENPEKMEWLKSRLLNIFEDFKKKIK